MGHRLSVGKVHYMNPNPKSLMKKGPKQKGGQSWQTILPEKLSNDLPYIFIWFWCCWLMKSGASWGVGSFCFALLFSPSTFFFSGEVLLSFPLPSAEDPASPELSPSFSSALRAMSQAVWGPGGAGAAPYCCDLKMMVRIWHTEW